MSTAHASILSTRQGIEAGRAPTRRYCWATRSRGENVLYTLCMFWMVFCLCSKVRIKAFFSSSLFLSLSPFEIVDDLVQPVFECMYVRLYMYMWRLQEADYNYYSLQAMAPGWPSISIPSLLSKANENPPDVWTVCWQSYREGFGLMQYEGAEVILRERAEWETH